MNKFIHLHVHSWFSLSDALASPKEIIARAKQLEAKAIGISEHGSLRSAYEFHSEAKKQGIKPIIGMEAYYCDQHDLQNKDESNRHILLIAKNQIGWNNLKQLNGIANRHGFYRNPRIDIDLLKQFKEGLICTTACVGGPLGSPLNNKKIDKQDRVPLAKYHFIKLFEIFGENLFLEIQMHNLSYQSNLNKYAMYLNGKYNVPLVLTCDAHYIVQSDCKAHDILVRASRRILNENTLCYMTDQLWLKSDKEIIDTFKKGNYRYVSNSIFKQAFVNTGKIADLIETYDIYQKKDTYPVYKQIKNRNLTNNLTNIEFLAKLSITGLKRKGLINNKEYRERLKTELKAIKESGFVDYFLIIWDIAKYAKQQNILMSPGRGSCTGSLVFYLTNVTHLDPIEYKLPFERFLKPGERVSPPDADLDFQSSRRSEILDYIKDKYGHDRVCNIITSNTLAVKNSIKNVAQVLDIGYKRVNSVTTSLPSKFTNFDDEKEYKDDLKEMYDIFEEYPELELYSKKLCGTPSHPGVHAAGLLITPTETEDWIPTANVAGKQGTRRTIVCEWDMHTIEDINLLKVDALGLTVLDCINETLRLIDDKEVYKEVAEYIIKPNDDKVFELFRKGINAGVFQFNSSTAVKMCKGIKPKNIHDLVAATSLGRTAVMKMGFHDEYISRLKGESEIEKYHPIVDKLLEPYLGIGYLQEVVMQITIDFAGFTYTEADALRKAMKHKSEDEFKVYEKQFLDNATKQSDIETAQKVWDFILKFSEYGFCLTGDTLIKQPVGNGPYKTTEFIDELKPGDQIISYNIDTDKEFVNEIVKIHDNGEQEIYEFELDNGEIIKGTMEHSFMCDDNRYHTLSDIFKNQLDIKIVVWDMVVNVQMKIKNVKSIGRQKVYCPEVKGKYKNFVLANGSIAHNSISHAYPYSYLGYIANWLKLYYPLQFYCGFLTIRALDGKIDNHIVPLIREAKSRNIKIAKPNINHSNGEYTILYNKNAILMGLSSIKGLGEKEINKIISGRENGKYMDIEGFIERSNSSISTIAALINAGCLDKYTLNWPAIGKRQRIGYNRYTSKEVFAGKQCDTNEEKIECIKFIKRSTAKAVAESNKYQGEIKAFGFLFSIGSLFNQHKNFYKDFEIYDPSVGFSSKFIQFPFAGILLSKDYKTANFITKGGSLVSVYYTASKHEVSSAKVGELWAGAILYIEDDKYTIRSSSKKYNLFLMRSDHLSQRFK